MIQRMQSVWLLLAALCGIATFYFDFYFGNKAEVTGIIEMPLNGGGSLLVTIATGATILVTLVSIFLFKNRKRQLKIVLVALLLSLLTLGFYFLTIKEYTSGRLTLFSVLAFAVPVFIIMAINGIRRDEKLIKNLDKLR